MKETQPVPLPDDRATQAARVADYLEAYPYSTQKEIDTACDTGCISKVLSDMPRAELPGMGYLLAYGWREQLCASGSRKRKVRTYALLTRPQSRQQDLFDRT
ncbi:hypothetical protein ACFQNJ_03590 [Hydrogenophaga bisanensis]|uniref:Helix-turn-helix domain-containing protein n=1 Tax=Hydrogenophaga bisanensis TaxID=439611 RepID=A0ABW2R6W7_9BURK